VPGAGEHPAEELAGGVDVEAAHEVHVFDFHVAGADGKAAEGPCLARDDQGVEIGKAQSEGRASAAVALGELVVVGGLEGADRLAHEREEAGQRPDGENERLVGVVPGFVRSGERGKQEGRQAAAARVKIAAPQRLDLAPARVQVDPHHAEMVPDHDSPPSGASAAAASPPISLCSRQSWGQKGTQRPQWMHTKGSPSVDR